MLTDRESMKNKNIRIMQYVLLTGLVMHAGFMGAMENTLFINVLTQDGKGCTPLHLATLNKDFAMVKFLLEKNADANIRDAVDITPLEYALGTVEDDNMGIVGLLLPHTDDKDCLNQKNSKTGETVLHRLAKIPGNRDNLALLSKYGAKQLASHCGLYPIHAATNAGYHSNVAALLTGPATVANNDDAATIEDDAITGEAQMKALFEAQRLEHNRNNPY
jgi:ankyrin repeat protein